MELEEQADYKFGRFRLSTSGQKSTGGRVVLSNRQR